MDVESDVRTAEVRKLEAERLKLELESKEIERRLSERWWQVARFPQYIVAIVITAALLFGWARAYLEPILRRETEVNALAERRNATLNLLLEAKNEQLGIESRQLGIERDKLKERGDQLSREAAELRKERQDLTIKNARQRRDVVELTLERDQLDNKGHALERQQQNLQTVVAGLRIAIDQVEKGGTKFFSILNSDDPINKLKDSYGWHVSSDNYYGRLGYYLVISHPSVSEGKRIFVGREFDLDRLKNGLGSGWQEYVAQVNEHSPFLALDYSYLALLADPRAPVGGKLYKKGGVVIDFHAPLSQWAKDLGTALAK